MARAPPPSSTALTACTVSGPFRRPDMMTTLLFSRLSEHERCMQRMSHRLGPRCRELSYPIPARLARDGGHSAGGALAECGDGRDSHAEVGAEAGATGRRTGLSALPEEPALWGSGHPTRRLQQAPSGGPRPPVGDPGPQWGTPAPSGGPRPPLRDPGASKAAAARATRANRRQPRLVGGARPIASAERACGVVLRAWRCAWLCAPCAANYLAA